MHEFCRLEASSSSVDIYPSSENSNGNFAVKNLSGDVAPKVEARGTPDPSWSAAEPPNSNQVQFSM